MYIPSTLNKKGEAHLKRELKALGLKWDIDATIEDISHKNSFQEMRKGTDSDFDYEITLHQLGKNGYGYYINFREKHIRWEKIDN